jgi:hypothetical protein
MIVIGGFGNRANQIRFPQTISELQARIDLPGLSVFIENIHALVCAAVDGRVLLQRGIRRVGREAVRRRQVEAVVAIRAVVF